MTAKRSPAAPARSLLNEAITEAQFQTDVIAYALLHGWLPYHTHDSQRSHPGFPDLVLVSPRAGRLVFAELKTMRGRISSHQRNWIAALGAVGQEVYIWRPDS